MATKGDRHLHARLERKARVCHARQKCKSKSASLVLLARVQEAKQERHARLRAERKANLDPPHAPRAQRKKSAPCPPFSSSRRPRLPAGVGDEALSFATHRTAKGRLSVLDRVISSLLSTLLLAEPPPPRSVISSSSSYFQFVESPAGGEEAVGPLLRASGGLGSKTPRALSHRRSLSCTRSQRREV